MKNNSIYEDLSKNIEKDLAIMLSKITHFIHKDIVEYIVYRNLEYKNEFISCMDKELEDVFFYEGSDCVFPGYRRAINYETKSQKWKDHINVKDGTILNGNTIPRHIWAYLVSNKGYSGGKNGMWSKSDLSKFELAHIFGHRKDEREIDKRFFKDLDETKEPYGLFTSASNTVLIPKGFAKPTDHMQSVKRCFYKRYLDYYKIKPIGFHIYDESLIPIWYKDLEWNEPILPENWKIKVDNLLDYRKKYLKNKYTGMLK